MNTDPIALMFLSDASVTPDLGLHYSKKLQEWIVNETDDDEIRAWFDDLGYPLANPDLLDASDEFRKMLHYWNGSYTVAFDGKYIPLSINEDCVTLDGETINDYHFSEDTLTWSKGRLHFELAMDVKSPSLTGKLVSGKLAKDGVIPEKENAFGTTIIMACPGDAAPSKLRAPNIADLDFFNGQYTMIPLIKELDLPLELTIDLSGEKGVLGFNTLGPATGYSNFYALPQAGQSGKWNENALLFYDNGSKYYCKIQFIVSPAKNKDGKIEPVKGFFGALTTDNTQLDIPNVMGVFRAKTIPALKKGSTLEEDSNKSSIAGTVLTGVGVLIAVGFFAWEQHKAKKSSGVEDARTTALDGHIRKLEAQLTAINSNTVDIPKIDITATKRDLQEKKKNLSDIERQVEGITDDKTAVERRIAELKRMDPDPLGKIKKELDKKEKELKTIEKDMKKKETEWKNTFEEIEARNEAIKQERLREAREKFKK